MSMGPTFLSLSRDIYEVRIAPRSPNSSVQPRGDWVSLSPARERVPGQMYREMRPQGNRRGEPASLTRLGTSYGQFLKEAIALAALVWVPPTRSPKPGHSQAMEPRGEAEGIWRHRPETTPDDGAGEDTVA